MKKLGLYIHIPFCESKCLYCDFITMPYQDKRIEEYFNLLIKEIILYAEDYSSYLVDSIYFGGGTPSYVDIKYIIRVYEQIEKKFNLSQDLEFTIEANPNTLDKFKLKNYLNLGINRLSLGIQSFNNEILKKIGRNYNLETVLKDIELIREVGFDNLNLDLIMGLPNQKLNDIYIDLKYIRELSPQHISYYDLIIEPNTRFNKLNKEKKLILPSEKENRKFYHEIIDYLNNMELEQYEISNFAKKDYKSRHNLKYWKVEEYLGFGLNASGFFNGIRYTNEYRFKEYNYKIINNIKPISQTEFISDKSIIFEKIIMNMRLVDGLDLNEMKTNYEIDFFEINKNLISEYIKLGYLTMNDNRITFTEKGFNISNNFFINMEI